MISKPSLLKPSVFGPSTKRLFLSLLALSVLSCNEQTTPPKQESESHAQLKAEFASPPSSSKPLTWLHAMSGNMSAAGITKDLESIAEVGIGGTMLFNVTQGIPLGKVRFNSTEHIELIGHLAKESQRLGLTFGMHNCDGWTSSGGPWVTPEHSMKRLTFSETVVEGGEINLALAQPQTLLDYYQDVAVIAYPALASEIDDANRKPVITSSDPNFKLTVLTNGDVSDHSVLTPIDGQPAWIQFAYNQPYTMRLLEMLLYNGRGVELSLHISDDGKTFTKVKDLPLRRPGKYVYGTDDAFAGHKAKYFRVVSKQPVNLMEVRVSSTPTMDNYTGRTQASRTDYQEFESIGSAPDGLTVKTAEVRDLTSSMTENGRLQTQLPEGKWTIMRFGYTSTGAVNIPASREGTGLEVDKFSQPAFKLHYEHFITNVLNQVKKVAPNALYSIEIDSYEVGAQNWTHDYEKLFEKEYGYDLVPYLPLFAGKFVDSATTAEAVLWDTRDFNNRLITENYYGYFSELAHKDGVKTYLEPYGSGPFNELDVARSADYPMGEFWLDTNNFRISSSASTANLYDKPIVAAEAFTQFPQNNWLFNPSVGKVDSDKSWALGVNQHVFHRFAHQANTHVMPGMTMNMWGAHFDRTQPWWNGAGKAWFEYITRGQHLLRVGNAVSDILWYLGDATPTICPEKDPLSSVVPVSINYDCLNTDMLHKLTVQDRKLVLPHGSQYKVLVLNNHKTLSFESLQKIYALAKQGVVIVGAPVEQLSGRFVTSEQQSQFEQMVAFIWSQPSTYNMPFNPKTTQGHAGIIPNHSVADSTLLDWDKIYAEQGLSRDLTLNGIKHYYFTHRKSDEHDIYFIYNESSEPRLIDGHFNVQGKIPELWDASTGRTVKLGAFEEAGSHTRVAFTLKPNQSMFVVFAESSDGVDPMPVDSMLRQGIQVLLGPDNQPQLVTQQGGKQIALDSLSTGISLPALPESYVLPSKWTVEFDKHYGLDQTFTFTKLVDWRDHPDTRIQDYSGTALYRQSFSLPAQYLQKNTRLTLDLGQVDIAATVTINGQNAGTAWVAPYQLDVTEFVKAGDNQIQIEVANLWVNRLLADRKLPDTSGFKIARWQDPITKMPQWYTDNQPPPKSERITFVTQVFMSDDEARQSSGLIGPVAITPHQIVPVSP
jgi:hypothetical protein